MISVIIVAGGSGKRMGKGINKAFVELCGKTILEHTVNAFENIDIIDKIIVVTRVEELEQCKRLFENKNITITVGGKERGESVYNGLKKADDGIVLIHDAARPFVDGDMVKRAIEDCKKFGASAIGIRCTDTLKRVDNDDFIEETVDRSNIIRIQTPQVFEKSEILKAYNNAMNDNFIATDDCAVYEKYIGRVKITEGKGSNIKITYPEDLILAKAFIEQTESEQI